MLSGFVTLRYGLFLTNKAEVDDQKGYPKYTTNKKCPFRAFQYKYLKKGLLNNIPYQLSYLNTCGHGCAVAVLVFLSGHISKYDAGNFLFAVYPWMGAERARAAAFNQRVAGGCYIAP